MKNATVSLKSLEADLAELQSLVKNLNNREEVLRKAVTRLNVRQVSPETEFANRRN